MTPEQSDEDWELPELRQDPFTRDWVVIAPGRAERPRQAVETPARTDRSVAFAPDCPFCPGNEDQTPQEVWRLPGAEAGSESGWSVRVVPNRHPILASGDGPARRRASGPHLAAEGLGAHEVVIETPRHDLDLPDADHATATAVFEAYRVRSRALRGRGPGLVLPFRNHGSESGTSLPHPHSQIVAVPIVPLRHRRLFDVARAHYDDHGSCLSNDVAAAEIDSGERVIAMAEQVIAVAPYASAAPYEVRVMPRRSQASFADASDDVLAETGLMVRRLLAALRESLGDVPYNYVLISAPNGEERAPCFSWHLAVLPRLTVAAGFELGTGMAVNPVPPERAARRLRQAMAREGRNPA